MYRVGQKEVDAIAKVLLSGDLFRYHIGGECTRFEARYAKYLGVKSVRMTSSGTTAITAALAGLGIGPGDEVIVPACTYMASAVSVLAVGAIPIVADVDESITLSPKAVDALVGPQTKAVIPVHMWGLVCDMDGIMKVAKKHNLKVVEDCCQCVGGGYKGRMVGSIGHMGAFSFNFYKNMTCGEGGAVVSSDDDATQRAACMI
ncbi:MAG: aminotransferase class V-fold PLP-dependent enzyme, partial [Armatimonadia bacterium]